MALTFYSFLASMVPLIEGGKEGNGCVQTFSLVPACVLLYLILWRGRDSYARTTDWETEAREVGEQEPMDTTFLFLFNISNVFF